MIDTNYLIFILRYIFKLFKRLHIYLGGFMFKLLIMGIFAGTMSGLTGIPLFPVSPVIHNNQLTFEPVKVDERKLNDFKFYIKSKM